MADWRCPMHGIVTADGDAPTCPVTLRRTIAREAIVGTCAQPMTPIDDDA